MYCIISCHLLDNFRSLISIIFCRNRLTSATKVLSLFVLEKRKWFGKRRESAHVSLFWALHRRSRIGWYPTLSHSHWLHCEASVDFCNNTPLDWLKFSLNLNVSSICMSKNWNSVTSAYNQQPRKQGVFKKQVVTSIIEYSVDVLVNYSVKMSKLSNWIIFLK